MQDIFEYVVTEIKRHFRTQSHYIRVFGRRRDISRVMTALKVAFETVSTASTISSLIDLLK